MVGHPASSRGSRAKQRRGAGVGEGAVLYCWLDQVAFPAASFLVCPLYVNPGVHDREYLDTIKDTGCIMNSPQRKMAHPLIGFDAQATADTVLDIAAELADSRDKPAIAIVRGMGGGKTLEARLAELAKAGPLAA